jgi:hypothetical protein
MATHDFNLATPDISKRASPSRYPNQTFTLPMRISASARSLIDTMSPREVAYQPGDGDVATIETWTEDDRETTMEIATAAPVASSRIYVISSSFVRGFISRLHERQLIKSTWRDLFSNCIPTIQSMLATGGGLSDAVWAFALQPYKATSLQVVRLVEKLKQAVYTSIAQPTSLSLWVVDCFIRCMRDDHVLGPWVTYLLAGSTCTNRLADRLALMGVTNASVLGGMISNSEMTTLDFASTLEERRLVILVQMKLAAISSVLYEDELRSGLVRCLVQRLRDDGTISHVEHARWMTDESIERITRHLQTQGCTNYGLSRFVLSESLDLRKTQFAQKLGSLHECELAGG